MPRVYERVDNVMKGVEEGSDTEKIFGWALGVGRRVAAGRAAGRRAGRVAGRAADACHQTRLLQAPRAPRRRIRFGVSGGAALPKHIGEFFLAAGIPIVEGYGLSETSPVLAFNPLEDPRYGTVGRVLPGVTVALQHTGTKEMIAEVDGRVGAGTLSTAEGEIVAKGPNIMRGYWNNEASTKEAIDADGWFHTGDVGRFVNGYLQITDRIKHMLVSKGGKNIYPGPIEDQLKAASTLIDQVLVVGEGRDYLTALVVPNLDNAKAQFPGAGLTDEASVAASADVKAAIEAALKGYSKTAAPHDKVRGVTLLAEAFTVDNEMMTPTLKLKRKVIEKHHAAAIEALYGAGDDD